MTNIQEEIDRLQTRLDNIVRSQIDFQKEVMYIRAEIDRLRSAKPDIPIEPARAADTFRPQPFPKAEERQGSASPPYAEHRQPTGTSIGADAKTSQFSAGNDSITGSARDNLEKFIGENLLSKIGILILIIGVAIGAKYAIDNGWISPLLRIVFGYFCGFALMGLAVRLKAKYINFSAVLLSGGIAVMYFITYFAYSLYQLFGQTTAFALMFLFTAFAVTAAIIYSRQIIAHIGLVGAYAIPFLLSDNSGRYAVLFAYIAIINAGILAVSLARYWKPLFYTSFAVTWLTFASWYIDRFVDADRFSLALIFATVYFAIFYVTFIGYKFRSGQNVAVENISLILANSSIYYGLGYSLISQHPGTQNDLGLFSMANAGIHLIFGIVATRIRNVSIDFVYLLGMLVLAFLTISVPVQFEGYSVTLIWTAEAALLFWIGRAKAIELYEFFSFPLIVLASMSLLVEFAHHIEIADRVLADASRFPLLNGFFVTSIFYVAAFALIYFINRDDRFSLARYPDVRVLVKYVVAAAALIVLYNAFRTQISDFFEFLQYRSAVGLAVTNYGVRGPDIIDSDLGNFSILWQMNYTMLFLTVIALVNIRWFQSKVVAAVNTAFGVLSIFLFITLGLYLLSELRESYLDRSASEYFYRGVFHILMRYVSYAFLASIFVSLYKYSRHTLLADGSSSKRGRFMFEVFLTVSLFFILSSELLNWMDIFGQKDSYKLGLSILWGVYSLVLVGLGIYFGRRHLRISAIVLFALTLLKIFSYDIADLDTISKTIVFVSLGALMLIVSFLYHKYRTVIFKVDSEPEKL